MWLHSYLAPRIAIASFRWANYLICKHLSFQHLIASNLHLFGFRNKMWLIRHSNIFVWYESLSFHYKRTGSPRQSGGFLSPVIPSSLLPLKCQLFSLRERHG